MTIVTSTYRHKHTPRKQKAEAAALEVGRREDPPHRTR
jgi:hypothetical protein